YVTGEGGFKLEVPLANVRVDPPLAGTRRILHLPGGAQLQTDADAALRALFPRSNRLATWVHALESRWPLALAGVVVAAAFSWWCVVYGLPLAAGLVATHVPVQVEVKLGEQTLASIDQAVCDKSDIGLAKQDKVRQDLAALTARLDDGYDYRLELRARTRLGADDSALRGRACGTAGGQLRLGRTERDSRRRPARR